MSNPFFDELDYALRGKQVHVTANDDKEYRGVLNRIDHTRGSVLLHDAKHSVSDGWETIGSVFVRNVATIYSLPKRGVTKDIEFPAISAIDDSPYYPGTVDDPPDAHLRGAYRNGFTGGFPVCRKTCDGRFELINGHKRIEACRRVGLERHPVEVIVCNDEQAEELVKLAHRGLIDETDD